MKGLILSWIIFNIFTSIYEIYFISVRHRVLEGNCKDNFWSKPITLPLFQELWTEYACKVDKRYFNPNSYVFVIEFINVLCTLFLILFYKTKFIKPILSIQFLNCFVYFATLERIPNLNIQKITYLLVSSIWLIGPLYLLKN